MFSDLHSLGGTSELKTLDEEEIRSILSEEVYVRERDPPCGVLESQSEGYLGVGSNPFARTKKLDGSN